MSVFDALGMIGVLFVLGAYAALQFRKLDPHGAPFCALNAIGAGLIVLSLLFDFNLSAFAMEMAWVSISVFGLVRAMRSKAKN